MDRQDQPPTAPKRRNSVTAIDAAVGLNDGASTSHQGNGAEQARPSPMGLEPVVVIQMHELDGGGQPDHQRSPRHQRSPLRRLPPSPVRFFVERETRSPRAQRGDGGIQQLASPPRSPQRSQRQQHAIQLERVLEDADDDDDEVLDARLRELLRVDHAGVAVGRGHRPSEIIDMPETELDEAADNKWRTRLCMLTVAAVLVVLGALFYHYFICEESVDVPSVSQAQPLMRHPMLFHRQAANHSPTAIDDNH